MENCGKLEESVAFVLLLVLLVDEGNSLFFLGGYALALMATKTQINGFLDSWRFVSAFVGFCGNLSGIGLMTKR